jgi:hypothetical protein
MEQERIVWIAAWSSQMDMELVGIFSTREAAEAAAKQREIENRYGDGYAECWEIDKGPRPDLEDHRYFNGKEWITYKPE